jgi:sialate O-acetylesterase
MTGRATLEETQAMRPAAACRTLVAVIACIVGGAPALADAGRNSLFSTGAVLQRGIRLPVWGTARDGKRVTVKLCGQTATATAVSGRWMLWLKPMRAGGPFTLEVADYAIHRVHAQYAAR